MGQFRKMIPLLFMLVIAAVFPAESYAAPSVTASGAILMDQDSGRVLYEHNAHEKRRIASITKIMTAILAIESGQMEKTVEISNSASGTEGSSLFLRPGQKMKLEDLVYGLMLRSGNDAAVAIAEQVGGSLEGFSWLMNKKAEEIGMKNTQFTNPHGLDNTKGHFSTAYDMALLTKYAMKNEKYRTIAGTKVHRAPNSLEKWEYRWTNKNRLLTSLYKYCTGGKTGYTKLAKRTLVTTASKNDMNLIAVTLNGPDDWNDHINMYESGFSGYQNTEILPAGSVEDMKIKAYKDKVYIKTPFIYPLAEGEKDGVEVKVKMLKMVWKEKRNIPDVVGSAAVYLDGRLIGSRQIYYGKPQPAFAASSQSFIGLWRQQFVKALGIYQHG